MLVKRIDGKLSGIVASQVDESLTMGDGDFLGREQEAAGKFRSKETIMLGLDR